MAARVAAEVDAAEAEVRAMPAGGHSMLGLFAEEIRKRCALVASGLRDDPGEDAEPATEDAPGVFLETAAAGAGALWTDESRSRATGDHPKAERP